ncbi:MAG TPA: PilZ domain-containing protein [Kofleriaceae bacterium]|jgi:Tfp pilus assembly protein PilZ|nr:PilZ domain-containing protein [Kofleriaceae bacterium]
MRLVTLAFATPEDFIAAYHPADGGSLSTRTRTDGSIGEAVLIEISFPGLPNRALVRAHVMGIAFEHGLRFAFDPADETTRDFLLAVAHGDVTVEKTVHREHARFPSALSATWGAPGRVVHPTLVEDLSAGGAFVRAETLPAVGDDVELAISTPAGDTLVARAKVAWLRQGKHPGFGVEFADLPGDTGRRLRALLRHASERAEVDLGDHTR